MSELLVDSDELFDLFFLTNFLDLVDNFSDLCGDFKGIFSLF
jgi:hypothetical protein